MSNLLDQLDLFHGETTDALAHIYARLPRAGLPEGCTLTGTLAGPDCRYAKTLTTRVKFADCGPGPTLLARAVLPDPCGWTPELPFLYRANLELRCRGELLASEERIYGIRRLGVRGKSFYWEGKRWVMRGVCLDSIDCKTVEDWRETGTAMFVENAPEELLSEASKTGIPIVHWLVGEAEEVQVRLKQIARFPAVIMSIFVATSESRSVLRGTAPDLLFAQQLVFDQQSQASEWADAVLWSRNHKLFQDLASSFKLPVIVMGSEDTSRDFQKARAQIDHVQRDVSPLGDFAGYYVG